MTSLTEDNIIRYSIDELDSYKNDDITIPLELIEYMNKIKNYSKDNSKNKNWRKEVINLSKSWLLENKNKMKSDESILINIQSILNKLSESNFDLLLNKLMNMNVKTKSQIIYIVDLIYKKAILENTFLGLYGTLCKELSNTFIEEDNEKLYFKCLLIDKCQENFNIILDPSHKYYPLIEVRKKVLGCIEFIGELYNQSIINCNVIIVILRLLFSKVTNKINNNEYIIEIICFFFMKIGITLKEEQSKLFRNNLNKLYSLKKTLKPREKFIIMDLEDADKKNSWKY
jgi:hypothetical protein